MEVQKVKGKTEDLDCGLTTTLTDFYFIEF